MSNVRFFGTVYHGPVAIVNINCKLLSKDAVYFAETFSNCFTVEARGDSGLFNIAGAMHQSQYRSFKDLLDIAMLDYKILRLTIDRDLIAGEKDLPDMDVH